MIRYFYVLQYVNTYTHTKIGINSVRLENIMIQSIKSVYLLKLNATTNRKLNTAILGIKCDSSNDQNDDELLILYTLYEIETSRHAWVQFSSMTEVSKSQFTNMWDSTQHCTRW